MRFRAVGTRCVAQGCPKAKIRRYGVRLDGAPHRGRHISLNAEPENGEASNGDGPAPRSSDYQWPGVLCTLVCKFLHVCRCMCRWTEWGRNSAYKYRRYLTFVDVVIRAVQRWTLTMSWKFLRCITSSGNGIAHSLPPTITAAASSTTWIEYRYPASILPRPSPQEPLIDVAHARRWSKPWTTMYALLCSKRTLL